jgi:nitroimidazol reductase NimA-like FMN-containing flavoprotein (pyridoxamine 5'-phosphate oxidase superfamily)
MLIREISTEECLATLARASVGRLGCSLNDQPYVVPIYFGYEGEWIYVFSTFGKKIEWMRANPKVCVEIEEKVSESEWISVLVNGLYEELAEPQFTEERVHARQLLAKRYHWWLNAMAERRVGSEDQQVEPLFFRIHVDLATGLRWGS